jgi:hypothetical protein
VSLIIGSFDYLMGGPGGATPARPFWNDMAYTEHLPIYKSSYDLCLCAVQVVHGFSGDHKYSLGTNRRPSNHANARPRIGVVCDARRER